MAQYTASCKKMDDQAAKLADIARKIDGLYDKLRMAQQQTASMDYMGSLSGDLRKSCTAISADIAKSKKLSSVLKQVSSLYYDAEVDCLKSTGVFSTQFLHGTATLDAKNEYGKYESKKEKIKEQEKKPYQQYAYDPATGQMVLYELAPEYARKGVTILEGELSAEWEGSVIDAYLAGKADWGEGSISAKMATAEAHASVSGGFYVYEKDVDGNTIRKFAPGVAAEIGVGASLLSLAAEGKIGDDMFGVYGSGEVGVGTAKAEAKANASYIDGKIQAQAKASAEANLFEAKGRAGGTIAGVDVGVTGGVTVGVGAHAEIGIVDGVVKVDIGASLGIGVSVGFEVDVGGAVDAICSGAKSVWDGVSNFFGW